MELFNDWDGNSILEEIGFPRKESFADLEATWFVIDREPDMDDLMEQAGESLEPMQDDLGVYPFQDTNGDDRLFLARYEFPKHKADFKYLEAVFLSRTIGFIDFLAGFPLECVEMLVLIGEHSSKRDTIEVLEGKGAAPPVPNEFFFWPEEDRILLNILYLAADNVQWLAQNLAGELAPQNLHWWLRVNINDEKAKFPVPGEFLGLGVRLMPDKPWGEQKSSPFIYSGNWMDTVFYTGARVKEVIEPDDEFPYPRYKIQWRKYEVEEAKPSDFAKYKVGDRVTILKDVAAEKESQLWKDKDAKKFEKDKWVIVPISFYGLEEPEEEE